MSLCFAASAFAIVLIAPVQPWSAVGALNATLMLRPVIPVVPFSVFGADDESSLSEQALKTSAIDNNTAPNTARVGRVILLAPWIAAIFQCYLVLSTLDGNSAEDDDSSQD